MTTHTIDSYPITSIPTLNYVVHGYNYKAMHLTKPGTYAKEAKMTSETKNIPRGKQYYSRRQNITLRWRHNGHDSVSNHQPYNCLLNRLFGCRSKKTSKLRVTGLCVGNSPGTGEFPAQMASNAENVSIRWRHHDSQRKYSLQRKIFLAEFDYSRKAYETCKNKFYSWKLLFLAELNFPHGNIFTHGNHLYSWK